MEGGRGCVPAKIWYRHMREAQVCPLVFMTVSDAPTGQTGQRKSLSNTENSLCLASVEEVVCLVPFLSRLLGFEPWSGGASAALHLKSRGKCKFQIRKS